MRQPEHPPGRTGLALSRSGSARGVAERLRQRLVQSLMVRHGIEDGSERVDALGAGEPGIESVDGRVTELFERGDRHRDRDQDIDDRADGLADGAVLLYDSATQQFLVKNEMDKATTKIIGGFY